MDKNEAVHQEVPEHLPNPPGSNPDPTGPISPPKTLNWYEQSFPFMVAAVIILPQGLIPALGLALYSCVNLDRDPWHKNGFQVFFIAMTGGMGMLLSLFGATKLPS